MLSAPQLLKDARSVSGLDDYGTTDFVEGLHVLVDAINTEAGLKPEFEARFQDQLIRLLVNRLRMHRDFVEHPVILEQEVLPPVFITSLPRTGSTKLLRVLASTGDFHFLNNWQMYNFAPFPDASGTGPDPRIKAADEFLAWLRVRSPMFLEGHPMYADEADEVMLLLDAGFNSLYQHAAYLHIPSYVEWVLRLDASLMYADLKRMLQYMQWQHFDGVSRRWLLKTPSALGTEADFEKVFKGTDFIVTHRHPRDMMASGAALAVGVGSIFNDDVDWSMVGQMALYNFSESSKKHVDWRRHFPADRVLDLGFEEVVQRDYDVLSRIYGFLGMNFTDSQWQRVQDWLAMDKARREPARKFTLSQFGLEPGLVDERFASYIDYYRDYL